MKSKKMSREEAIEECREAIGTCNCYARGTWGKPIFGDPNWNGDFTLVWPGCSCCYDQCCGRPVTMQTWKRAIGNMKNPKNIAALLD